MNRIIRRIPAIALTLLSFAPGAFAGPGHDHGEAPAIEADGPTLPRFTAVSELFELVGIVDGDALTLYLDRFTDNAPVSGATLELELGEHTLTPEADGAGRFRAALPDALPEAEYPVVATVSTDTDVDLLVATLDLRHEAHDHDEAVETPARSALLPWSVAAASTLVALGLLFRQAGRRREGASA